ECVRREAMAASTPPRPEEAMCRLGQLALGRNGAAGRPDGLEAALAELDAALAGQRGREEELRLRVERMEDSYQEAVEALARYRELFEFAPDCYLVTDFAGVIREANQAAAVLLRTPRQFLPGKPLLIYLAREEWP